MKFNEKGANRKDKLEELFQDYCNMVDSVEFLNKCPLIFWKLHEARLKPLADMAKKFLGVPASSAAVERMFSIAGHVLNSKRAKMSARLFCHLVF